VTRNITSGLLRGGRQLSFAGVTLMGAAAVLSAAMANTASLTASSVTSSFVVTAAPAAPSAPTFRTLDDQADPTFNQLLGINDNGRIAGYFGSGAGGHPNKGYVITPNYSQGRYTNENIPGSMQTQVTGINNSGVTVGFWVDGQGGNFGFVDHNGHFTSVTDPNTTSTPRFNQLLGINDHNIAVGFYNDANGKSHGYTYNVSTGSFHPVTLPVAADSITATGINNRGDISGFYTSNGATSGFLLTHAGFRQLSFGSGNTTQALGVNQADEVVGSYLDGTGATHGFIWSHGNLTTIDDPKTVHGPTGMTVVNGLNNRGQLVGFYLDSAGNTDGMLVQGQP